VYCTNGEPVGQDFQPWADLITHSCRDRARPVSRSRHLDYCPDDPLPVTLIDAVRVLEAGRFRPTGRREARQCWLCAARQPRRRWPHDQRHSIAISDDVPTRRNELGEPSPGRVSQHP
jgi:hypothetical protein